MSIKVTVEIPDNGICNYCPFCIKDYNYCKRFNVNLWSGVTDPEYGVQLSPDSKCENKEILKEKI